MRFPEVTSTNTVAGEWVTHALAEGDFGAFCRENLPALVVAERQTAGKGRNGKAWTSPPGCLMFTLVFSRETVDVPPEKTPLLGLAAGLAVRDAVREVIPEVEKVGRLGIHWPNDVCLMVAESGCGLIERKLCGILVEKLVSGVFIAGIGVNVHNSCADAPPEVRGRLFSLTDIAQRLGNAEFQRISSLSLDRMLDVITRKFPKHLAALSADSAALVREVDACCVQRGQRVTLRTPGGEVSGFCTGLAADGHIILDGKSYHTGEFSCPASGK